MEKDKTRLDKLLVSSIILIPFFLFLFSNLVGGVTWSGGTGNVSYEFVNSSDFWDNLDDPTDIPAGFFDVYINSTTNDTMATYAGPILIIKSLVNTGGTPAIKFYTDVYERLTIGGDGSSGYGEISGDYPIRFQPDGTVNWGVLFTTDTNDVTWSSGQLQTGQNAGTIGFSGGEARNTYDGGDVIFKGGEATGTGDDGEIYFKSADETSIFVEIDNTGDLNTFQDLRVGASSGEGQTMDGDDAYILDNLEIGGNICNDTICYTLLDLNTTSGGSSSTDFTNISIHDSINDNKTSSRIYFEDGIIHFIGVGT